MSKNPFYHWKLVFLSYSMDKTFSKDFTINSSPSPSKPMCVFQSFFFKSIFKGFTVGSTYKRTREIPRKRARKCDLCTPKPSKSMNLTPPTGLTGRASAYPTGRRTGRLIGRPNRRPTGPSTGPPTSRSLMEINAA